MEYLLKVRNSKSGEIEEYSAKIRKAAKIPNEAEKVRLVLDFWQNVAGYEIVSCVPVITVD